METTYYTCEDCVFTLQNPTPECLDEWLKEHHGHKITTRVKTVLYDLGYNDIKKADDLAVLAKALNAVVADVRFMPHTRNPEFSQKHLVEVLGENYVHIPELGNSNYKGEGDIQLVNADAGIEKIDSLLANKSVIVMCACWKRSDCHRLHVTGTYEKRFGLETQALTRQLCREIITANSTHQQALF